MSWILGAFGPRAPEIEAKLRNIAPSGLFHYQDRQLFLLAGGISETCKSNATDGNVWVVCGSGIEHKGTK